MRAPDQINKQHPETDLMTQAIIRGAEGYRVAVPMMVAWDNLPRSVQVAICMEFADLRTPDAQPEPADRKALVGVIREAEGAWVNAGKDPNKSAAPFIADTLLARGLRLPAPETGPRRCAECTCEGGEHECNWIKPSPSAPETLADVLQEAFNRYASTNEGRPIGEYLAAAVRGQDS